MSLLYTMSLPVLISVFLQPSFSCGVKTDTTREARVIHLSYAVPIVNTDGSIVKTETRYEKYTLGNLNMYRFYYNDSKFENGKLLSHENRFRYFVFHKDSIRGLLCGPFSISGYPEGLYPVDSVLKQNLIKNDRVDVLADVSPDSVYFLPNGDKVKMYAPVPDSAQPEPYKLSFFYTKDLRDINEKLSEKMENEPGMTLYKINIHSDGFYYKKYKMKFPARDYVLEIKELAPEKNPEVLKYFDQYLNVVKE